LVNNIAVLTTATNTNTAIPSKLEQSDRQAQRTSIRQPNEEFLAYDSSKRVSRGDFPTGNLTMMPVSA
jgi:hypothetical protein